MKTKIYPPTPKGTEEMLKDEYTEAMEEMECYETQKHLKVCKKCQKFIEDLDKQTEAEIEQIQLENYQEKHEYDPDE